MIDLGYCMQLTKTHIVTILRYSTQLIFFKHFVLYKARFGEIQDKQSKVDRVKQLSKEIENETIDPQICQPFVKEAEALDERWNKNKDLLENYGEKDTSSKASSGNCCIVFFKKRLLPVWSYN